MRGLVRTTWVAVLLVGGCSKSGSNSDGGGSAADSATSGGDGSATSGGDGGATSGGDGNATSAGDGVPTTSAGDGGSADGSTGGVPGDCPLFPADNPWNTDISGYPVHAMSDAFIASIGADTNLHPDFGSFYDSAPIGIPWIQVDDSVAKVPVTFDYADESDPGPYPIPPDAPIEGGPDAGGDRHVLLLHTGECKLYELFAAYPENNGASWTAGSGAIFDLTSNDLRPEGWTSADAAGLPILPGLVRYEEVVQNGVIPHALRFTVSQSQSGYIHPATHAASDSTDATLPPMGLRLRLKADYDCSGYSAEVQVICTALKTYGMFVADNGSDWYVSGDHNPDWNDDALGDLKQIPGNAFEVIDTGEVIPG